MTTLDICLCTFQRDSVTDTLRSLMAAEIPDGVAAEIIVVDNDDQPSARHRVVAVAKQGPLQVTYIHHPGRNISAARNACLEASEADLVAFIDDDELASPMWLSALIHEYRANCAQVVIGPVDAVYPADAPDWMRRAQVHSTRPVWAGGTIRSGYTSNALVDRRSPEIRAMRFDLAFGRTGGEDTDFFSRIVGTGGRIAYASEALILEPVTSERLAFRWLARRRFRMGQTHARGLMRQPGATRLASLAAAGAKICFCLISAAITLPDNRRRNMSVLRACLHAGVIAGLVGYAPLTLYGSDQVPGEGRI